MRRLLQCIYIVYVTDLYLSQYSFDLQPTVKYPNQIFKIKKITHMVALPAKQDLTLFTSSCSCFPPTKRSKTGS